MKNECESPRAAAAKGKGGARRWAGRLGRAALVVLVCWALYRALDLDLGQLRPGQLARWSPAVWPVALSAVALIAVYVLHALLWRRIAGDIGGEAIRLRTALRIYFLANLGRYLPGKVWQVAGYAALAERAGFSAVTSLAAAALAQLAFLATGIVFFTALLPRTAGPVPILAAAVVIAVLAAAFYALTYTRAGERLRDWLGRRLGDRIRALLEVGDRIRWNDLAVWALGYAGSWLLLGAAFVGFAAAFVPDAAARPGFVAGSLAAAYVGGYVAVFAPAGVGVREGVLAVLLAEVVPADAALVIAVASRAWFTLTELAPLGVIGLLHARPSPALGNSDAGRAP